MTGPELQAEYAVTARQPIGAGRTFRPDCPLVCRGRVMGLDGRLRHNGPDGERSGTNGVDQQSEPGTSSEPTSRSWTFAGSRRWTCARAVRGCASSSSPTMPTTSGSRMAARSARCSTSPSGRRPASGQAGPVVTLDMQTRFLAPGHGILIAEGRVTRAGRSVIFCEAEIRDAAGELVATATGLLKPVENGRHSLRASDLSRAIRTGRPKLGRGFRRERSRSRDGRFGEDRRIPGAGRLGRP